MDFGPRIIKHGLSFSTIIQYRYIAIIDIIIVTIFSCVSILIYLYFAFGVFFFLKNACYFFSFSNRSTCVSKWMFSVARCFFYLSVHLCIYKKLMYYYYVGSILTFFSSPFVGFTYQSHARLFLICQ